MRKSSDDKLAKLNMDSDPENMQFHCYDFLKVAIFSEFNQEVAKSLHRCNENCDLTENIILLASHIIA